MSAPSQPQIILLPNVELNMEQVTVTNVFVNPGDLVSEGQALGAVETQKANIEIPSPRAGFVHEVFIIEGQEIGEKAPVCSIGTERPQGPAQAEPAPSHSTHAAPEIEPGAVGQKVRASPVARKVAKSLGLELTTIPGTGPNGRITRTDVENFQTHRPLSSPVPASPVPTSPIPTAPEAPAPRAPSPATPGGEWQPFPATRAGLIAQMELAARTIPVFSVSREFDVTPLTRKQPGVTFTHRLIFCLGRALAVHPALRTSIEGNRFRIEDVSVAVAMDTAAGLQAPAIRLPQDLSLPEIAATVQLLKARGDAGQLKRADFERAPFAISNLGMLGVDAFQPSVFAGQAAVLGTGRAVDAAGGRKTAWFTLSCDHRAADGAEAAGFLQSLQREIDSQ